jgi:large subunit ribosomal protein L7/L12
MSTLTARMNSWLGFGGGTGVAAVIAYAIATDQREYRTVTESVILVGLLYLFTIVMVIGIARWASRKPNYQIGLRAYLLSWIAGVIVVAIIDSILYRRYGYFGFRNRWANSILMGGVFAMSLAIASRVSGLRPKSTGSGEPPLVELLAADGALQAADRPEFTLTLIDYPASRKIRLIKVIRELMGLGIKEAKDLVEASPSSVQVRMAVSQVGLIKQKLEETGAQVEIR